ncbi:MAG: ATPase [Bradyrhizobiaceae bacterium]|nr:ATPase [Bradyrhizobiaceae bacterium]
MRDLLEELEQGAGNPMDAARRAMRPALPKRFYKEASIGERDGQFVLLLDGKLARTPARNSLAAPSRPLMEAVAAEWNAIGETIDPALMPLTRLVNVAIDRVAGEAEAVAAETAKYAGSDLICYRAGSPAELAGAQTAAWDPVLDWVRETLGARFTLSEGVTFVDQPQDSVEAIRAEVARYAPPFALAALATATSITGSVLLALALARGRLSADEAWAAAHIDEQWNAGQWGEDSEAQRRLAARRAEFDAAAKVLELS